jgi:hypothetical protein
MSTTSIILKAFAIAATVFLDPEGTRDYDVVTTAIVNVVDREPALFADDPLKLKTTGLMLAVGWREGSLREKVRGDCSESKPGEPCKGKPHSFCFAQIHDTSGGSEELNDDPEKCASMELSMLRTSIRSCTSHPVAHYAAGPQGCTNARAQKISADRIGLAKRIVSASAEKAKAAVAGREIF